jgi:hypothetical protein
MNAAGTMACVLDKALDRVAIPGKDVWNEAAVAWTKHRDVQKPVDQQLARVRVKVTLNRTDL